MNKRKGVVSDDCPYCVCKMKLECNSTPAAAAV